MTGTRPQVNITMAVSITIPMIDVAIGMAGDFGGLPFCFMRDIAMRKIFALFCLMLALPLIPQAHAGCQCECVNGQVVPLCDSSLDIRPICPPQVCPIVAPSVQPIQAPMVPPIGTQNCSQQQVYNQSTNQYEWKTVCY